LSADTIHATVLELAATVSREYMDPIVAEHVAVVLRRRLAEGQYLNLTIPDVLAARLTYDLLLESRDKHLRVAVVSASDTPPAATANARQDQVVRTNAGVQRVEILAGNVGYLNLTAFRRAEEARETIADAMRLLHRADALIIDLRQNGGGSPDTVALTAGYVFDEPALPLFQIFPRAGDPVAYATPAEPPAVRDGRRPVYVLTSSRTFSAGEGFAFLVQERGRAEVIGERTGGAANPGRSYRVHEFEVTIPNGRVRSAISGGNWEGRGVLPDTEVAAADALTVAHARALKRLIDVATGEWRVRLGQVLQALDVPAAPALASSQAITATDSELAERVDALMKQGASSGFGGAVVLERNGRVLLSKGYGMANRRLSIPFTADTVAPVNSITKTVTALAVMQLSAKGLIDLQASLGEYLKGAGEPAASSRIHDVLVHHAGLPPHCGEDWERRTKAQLIDQCTPQPLAAPRGTLSYSNPGYSYLAAIVEEVSGQAWDDYLRVHVFEAAGMNRTGWPFGNRATIGVAEGYVNDVPRSAPADRLAALGPDVWNWKGNGELHASAADMHRFYRFLMQQPARILEPMTMPQTAEYRAGVREGYGFALRFDRSGKIYRVGSSGSDDAFASYFMWLPQHGVFMYFVGNNGEQRVRPILIAVIDTIQKSVGAGEGSTPR
jgi:CubicO group peptidase (beta-lactamase class C family)